MIDSGYFNSDDEKLYYKVHLPESCGSQRIAVLFVHAAGGNRFGPHRMFVEYADKLSNAGLICIRFDLTGCGDSTGICSDQSDTHHRDIVSAIHYFREKYSLDSLYVLGISRGAYLAHRVICENKLPVEGAVLLSCPVSSNKAAIGTFASRLKGYWIKLFDPKSLRKFLSGRANVRFIFRSLIKPFSMKKQYSTDHKSLSIARTSCPMLFIYGQNDSICIESAQHYKALCKRLDISYQEHTVAHANHSFFHYCWKDEVHEVLSKWLNERGITK